MKKNIKLKPCPFCGGEATITNRVSFYSVGCTMDYMCPMNINHDLLLFVSEETAAKSWNRRADNEKA